MNIHIDIHVSTKYYCISWRFFLHSGFHSPSNFVTFYMAWRVGCKATSLVFSGEAIDGDEGLSQNEGNIQTSICFIVFYFSPQNYKPF